MNSKHLRSSRSITALIFLFRASLKRLMYFMILLKASEKSLGTSFLFKVEYVVKLTKLIIDSFIVFYIQKTIKLENFVLK